MAPPKIVVAGFGPFAGAPKNPSSELAARVATSRRVASTGVRIHYVIIPTEYQEVFSILPRLLKDEKPDAVLLFGLAGSTPFVRIETKAVNVASSVYPDAAGKTLKQHTLVSGAPHILPVRGPRHRLLHAALNTGTNSRLSVSAGRYICNAAFFVSLDMARQGNRPQFVSFVHIPWPRGRARRQAARRDRRPTMQMLVHAGEAILLALISGLRTKAA